MLTDSLDWAPPPLLVPIALSVNLSFMMLFQIEGRLYCPPSLLSEGFKARMCIASFTPLSNHLCSTSSIFVFSNMMVWSGLSVCMCFETSDVVELGLLCSPNLAFGERSVSPTYVASHSSQLILYTEPTILSFPTGSFGWTNSWRRVFMGLKYVGIPCPQKVLFSSSEKPLMYGIITGLETGWRIRRYWRWSTNGLKEE